jgi:Janus kinase 2
MATERKIHGPIGGEYSYNKIKENAKGVGTYIIRQCEKEPDIYYIDILAKKNQSCATFKIFLNGASNSWQLYDNENNEVSAEFEDLVSLARSIPIDGNEYIRLPPSRYEKPPLLLLCQTSTRSVPAANVTLSSSGPRTQRPTVFTNEDFRIFIPGTRDIYDGAFEQRKAEFRDRNTEVTLKILKNTENLTEMTEFHRLADKWAKLDISEIVRLNGLILFNPTALVLEPLKYGPLDIFLRTHEYRKQIVPLNLVETAYSLARALYYLVSNSIRLLISVAI